MNKITPISSIIVPVFNERENIENLLSLLVTSMRKAKITFEIICIDDNSTDGTYEFLSGLKRSPFVRVFKKKGKKGKAFSLHEGFSHAKGKYIVIIDGDLQDPPELITDFHELLLKGYDVIYAIRKNRKESFLKKLAYSAYYRLQKRISSFEYPFLRKYILKLLLNY